MGEQLIYTPVELANDNAWGQQRTERPHVSTVWQGRGSMYGNDPILACLATAAVPLRERLSYSGPTTWFSDS